MTRAPAAAAVAGLAALAGCVRVTDVEWAARLDADGDGAIAATLGGPDCDDGDPRVRPGADDGCNGRDDDCNGVVDDGPSVPLAHWDGDGDGVGAGEAAPVCAEGGGWVRAGGDCDDGDATVAPGLPEQCNGRDDDCDPSTTDPDPPTWYVDADGDGYGDAAAAVQACAAPAGTVDRPTDCDDTRADAHPGFPEGERCGDGVDNDCDGAFDGCVPSGELLLDTISLRVEAAAGTGLGMTLAATATAGGVDAVVVGWPGGAAGGAIVVPGAPTAGARADAAGGVLLRTGPWEGAGLGAALAGGADLTADGHPDLLLGFPGAPEPGGAHEVWLWPGPAVGTGALAPEEAALILRAPGASAFGASVGLSAGGVVATDPEADGGAGWAVRVPAGRAGVVLVEPLPADASAVWGGAGEALGASVAAGSEVDVDGDGLSDTLLGAPGHGAGAGRLLLWPGALGGERVADDLDMLVVGAGPGDAVGACPAQVGDLDGDGAMDLLLPLPGGAASLAAWVPAPVAPSTPTGADGRLLPVADGAPGCAAALGDLDGDGAPEVLAGLPALAGGAGGVAVVPGPVGSGAWAPAAVLAGGPDAEAGHGVAVPAGRPVVAGADLVWLTATLGR